MQMIERVAAAIGAIEIGYSMRLVSLINDVSTYELRYEDGERLEFPCTEDVYEHIRKKKLLAQAQAALDVLQKDESSEEPDTAQEELEHEHRLAQAGLRRKCIDIPAGKVMRYDYVYDESEERMCDKVWIDRLAGNEVMRYDAADPANTDAWRGARPDEESFVRRGLDIYELIDAEAAKPLPRFPRYDDFYDYEDWEPTR